MTPANYELKAALCKRIIESENNLSDLRAQFERLPDLPIFYFSEGGKSYYQMGDETGNLLAFEFATMKDAYDCFTEYAKSLEPNR